MPGLQELRISPAEASALEAIKSASKVTDKKTPKRKVTLKVAAKTASVERLAAKTIVLPNGNIYQGEVLSKDSKSWIPHGIGQEFQEGSGRLIYSGCYEDGARRRGKLYDHAQNIIFDGNFVEDKPLTGTYFDQNGLSQVNTMEAPD